MPQTQTPINVHLLHGVVLDVKTIKMMTLYSNSSILFRHTIVSAGILVGIACGIGGCKSTYVPPVQSTAKRDSLLARSFSSNGQLQLQEDSDVTNVNPHVRFGSQDNILVADFAEFQLRVYDAVGHLLHHYGSKGREAGQFSVPLTSVLQLSSGTMVVTDFGGTIFQLDSGLSAVMRKTETDLLPLYSATIMNDSTLLLIGRPRSVRSGEPAPLLHLFDLKSNRITRSFFTAPVQPFLAPAAVSLGITSAAIHADTIATVFALTDTIFLFNTSGAAIGRVPIPFRLFSYIKHPAPSGETVADRERWLREISLITDIFWLRDGSFIIQFYRDDEPRKENGLLIMDRLGRVRMEALDTPRLIAMDEERTQSRFFFASSGREGMRVWNMATYPAMDSSH